MIRGILVYDKKDAEYNQWFIEHLIEKGREEGLWIELKLSEELYAFFSKRNGEGEEDDEDEKQGKFPVDDISFAIMRNRDYKMSESFEKLGIRCFNSSYVCKIGNDKWEMFRDFSQASIPVMYTQSSKLPFPFVMKPKGGHGGKDVYLVKNAQEFERISTELNSENNSGIISADFIYQMPASQKGRDIRVYVVGDTILTAMERKVADGSDEFRANFSLGGSAVEHALTDDELKLAAKVANHIKADFVGIDLIYNNGKPVVNEVEDAVGTRMLYANTDIDAVEEYIKWIRDCLSE